MTKARRRTNSRPSGGGQASLSRQFIAGHAPALGRAGITNFRWHDPRHTWASWLRQNDVPTWVLQELGGWKSETMVRRYAHMSVKHFQPYADQLIFDPDPEGSAKGLKSLAANVTKSPTEPAPSGLRLW